MRKLSGVVEWKGTQWNGALTVNGQKFNFKKGVDHSLVNEGDNVLVTLGDWEFKGKTGENITAIELLGKAVMTASPASSPAAPVSAAMPSVIPAPARRDFDKEARGKTFCNYMSSLLANPSVDTSDLDKLFTLVDKCVSRTFGE